MGYEESLKQAKDLLVAEIQSLKDQLARKEASLKKLESFLREPGKKQHGSGSLTQQIVELVYNLVMEHQQAVSAKIVVKEFYKSRNDVNESTIRSTLYQVTRKQKPTEVVVDDSTVMVKILKKGPNYDVQILGDHAMNRTAQS